MIVEIITFNLTGKEILKYIPSISKTPRSKNNRTPRCSALQNYKLLIYNNTTQHFQRYSDVINNCSAPEFSYIFIVIGFGSPLVAAGSKRFHNVVHVARDCSPAVLSPNKGEL